MAADLDQVCDRVSLDHLCTTHVHTHGPPRARPPWQGALWGEPSDSGVTSVCPDLSAIPCTTERAPLLTPVPPADGPQMVVPLPAGLLSFQWFLQEP